MDSVGSRDGHDIRKLAHDLNEKLRSNDVAIDEDITFDDFQLTSRTREGLKLTGFDVPSPVQLQSIPLGRCGFDLVVQSKAGTGKTCVFTVVALEAFSFNPIKSAQSLIIAPTREIAIQIHEVVTSIGAQYRDLISALCTGGYDVKTDKAKLNSGAQIIIGTPGRIKQLIELNILKTQQIELFVLDEADKLMDKQFKIQIDEIYKRLPRDKQMIATSATYPNELALFIQQYMQVPQCVRVGQEITLDAIQEYYVAAKAGTSTKKSFDNKMEVLKELLLTELQFMKCFVFTNYQARAPKICSLLNDDEKFVDSLGQVCYLCAELDQSVRNSIFKKFKGSPQQKILVSTDLSARGIDISDIDIVINFDIPNDRVTYHHRVGRAGRFGQLGKAFTIVSADITDQTLFEKNVRSDKVKQFISTHSTT